MVSVFMKKTYCKNIMILGNDPNLSVYCLNQPRQIIRRINKVTTRQIICLYNKCIFFSTLL